MMKAKRSARTQALTAMLLLCAGGAVVLMASRPQAACAQATAAQATALVSKGLAPELTYAAQEQNPRDGVGGAARALQRSLSLERADVGLEEALWEIARQSGLGISYNPDVLPKRRVSLHVERGTVAEALRRVLSGTGLKSVFSSTGEIVVVARPLEKMQARGAKASVSLQRLVPRRLDGVHPAPGRQTGTITGTVTDGGTGNPLPGVNVTLEGTQRGAATGAEGQYEITGVEVGTYAVSASFIGYGDETQEGVQVQEGQTTTVDFALQQEAAGLDEVVVVGYGEQQKGNLTGAVESVQGEELDKVKATQTSSALQGLVPGLTVTRGSGAPGSGGTPRIRGIGTLGDSNPLVIVDGMQSSLDAVDPNNIESISVLKDAASASIYGSRAANGVILIETKRAPEGGRASVSYDGRVGWQKPTRLPDYLGGYQYMTKLNEARENEGKPPVYSQEYIAAYQKEGLQNRDEYPNTDWQDALLQPSAMEQHHNLAVSGERTGYGYVGR